MNDRKKIPNSFAARMKKYEVPFSQTLVGKMPVIIRVDGKNFSKFSKSFCQKPFDRKFTTCMENAAIKICKNAQNVRIAYTQSDEISILMTDYKNLNTSQWFDNKVQKIASVSAGLATAGFIETFINTFLKEKDAQEKSVSLPSFDARVFNLPREEVVNYFIWRQRDAERNSVSMLARANFSHNMLNKVNRDGMIEMLRSEKNINWNELDTCFKRGSCIKKVQNTQGGNLRSRWEVDDNTPIFSKKRDYIESFVQEQYFE